MAINPGTVLPIVSGALTANGIVGTSAPQFANAITNGFVQYVISGITVSTVDVGTAGAGAGTGLGIILPVPILQQNFASTFPSASINGISALNLINALSISFSSALGLANITTAHVGVAVGGGQASLVPAPPVSVPSFIGSFVASALVGISSAGLATAIAQGLDQSLPSATGVVVIAGPPSPTSSTGKGVGKIL